MQRPTDRDERAAAEQYAESLSELPEARLVSSLGRPKEVLLSDHLPEKLSRQALATVVHHAHLRYPEWDWRSQAYRDPGAIVQLLPPQLGPHDWAKRVQEEHCIMVAGIRRRFEALRAQRARLHKQDDGDEVDIEAYIEAYSDFRAGYSMRSGLYQTTRNTRRDLAVLLLADASGSTDSWISTHRRVIDVEREALLLMCGALQSLADPFAALAFSGESAACVTVCTLKGFGEPYGESVGQRIAALQPGAYTRAGAAIRHATALLMKVAARHRLLLMLSDGRPNDVDEYDGTYGVEDTRQAVVESRLQGINSFCLTIDRQAPAYMPRVFGATQYALLSQPENLSAALLDWLKRLLTG